VRRTLNTAIGLLSALLAVAPLAGYWLTGAEELSYLALCMLNLISWFCIAILFVSRNRMLDAVERATKELGLPKMAGPVEERLSAFVREAERYHRAAYAFRAEENLDSANLSQSLQQIAFLAYKELRAQSVELSLYDESSMMWSKSFVVGEPKNPNSQAMLVEAASDDLSSYSDGSSVLTHPVTFAGTMFGQIRIEFEAGYKPTSADREVAYLLSSQGAIMLVDARFTDELLRMRRLGEESVKAKTGFLATLSHEIRGPLGIILNGIELILDGLCGPVTESQKETCKMVQTSGEHLLDLVNDVLDYAKVEAGKVTAKPVELALKPLLTDITNVVRSQAMAKKHKLKLEPVDAALGMECDKRHARQMLINLLTNAVKYTPEGGSITVKAERTGAGRIEISVQDTGVGIPESEKPKVFGAFERVENQYSMAQVGTGLGMPLTKKLAEVNRGSVDFESTEGEGSRFWISMPAVDLGEEEEEVKEDLREKDRAPQGQGEQILLVDHNEEARSMLERYLVHQGFNVVSATSNAELIRLVQDHKIELAVVENDMPDTSGEEIITLLRSSPKTSKVPIILLSSKAFVFDIERFLKLGVDRCLSKPVDLSEIATTSRQLIDEARSLKGEGSEEEDEEITPVDSDLVTQ